MIEPEFVGLTLSGQAKPEAPAQAELCPTFAGSRGEAFHAVNLPL
jgi:hypothetical protein